MHYYVSQKNTSAGSGTQSDPFQTIGQAARIAMPGDTVIIGDGVYREWVDPQNGGLGDNQRITYISAAGEHPVVSGAEPLGGWEHWEGTIWSAAVPNTLFGEYNPYADEIFGDWYDGLGQTHHTGELFAGSKALFEAPSLAALRTKADVPEKALRWFAVVEQTRTVFYADLGGQDPNTLPMEFSVRPFCFFPRKEGIGYLTVSGLALCRAATQWAPPTAFQPGLIGTHWSKGWVIENCKIYDSKCCGVSLGKKRDAKDNCWSYNPSKSGTQTYTESIFSNLRDGWSKETVGGHTVRNNEIYNCGQTGIVGCMGGAFCEITGNHIHHINTRYELGGAEIAGIKLHAAIDTVIEKNVIHDCSRGLWLDWQAQGAAVRKNVFFRNEASEDMFIEVCQGPCMVENNLMLSGCSLVNFSQGTALVHNLFAGKLLAKPDTSRFTFYHVPHATAVQGMILVYGGDDRVLNNIFLGQDTENRYPGAYGTACYEGYLHAAVKKTLENDTPACDVGRTLPVIVRDNLYLNGAESWAHEQAPHTLPGFRAELSVTEEDGRFYLCSNLGELAGTVRGEQVTTVVLGSAFEPEQPFENRDGSPLSVDSDFLGQPRGAQAAIGPFEHCGSRVLLI